MYVTYVYLHSQPENCPFCFAQVQISTNLHEIFISSFLGNQYQTQEVEAYYDYILHVYDSVIIQVLMETIIKIQN